MECCWFGQHLEGPVIPFGAMVEYHSLSAKDLSRLHQFESLYQAYSLAMRYTRGDSGKETFLVADIEELVQTDASEIHARRLNAKEVLTPKKGDNLMFPVADGTVKICGGDQRLRTSTLIQDRPDRGEEQGKPSRRIRRVFFNSISRLIVA